ncbi:MAG: dethiobiotin synthase [Thiotrichales bacterium]
MSKPLASRGVFITGTDTGVGKTYVGSRLARRLHDRGIDVEPRKPVETGCARQGGEFVPADAYLYWQAVDERVPLETICPFRLATPASPERAAEIEGVDLALDQLASAASAGGNGYRLIEGAGGFYSPIAPNALNADLAARLNLPVLLVVGDRLGCVNHALLTIEAIARRGLALCAVVMNAPDADEPDALRNDLALARRLSQPLVRVRGQAERAWLDELIAYLPGIA